MEKVLTVIVPTYNMEKFLRRCLDSLVCEDANLFNQLEVLVVNDGSKDSSSIIGHEYENIHPNIFKVIDKENKNYGSCINRGLAEARGKYIKVLDADDTFDKNNFPLFISFLANNDVDCLISDMVQEDQSGNIKLKVNYKLPSNSFFTLADLDEQTIKNMWMHCVCYKTENLRRINYSQTEGISYTDQEWICVPMSTSQVLAYFPKVVYHYLVGRDGQTINPEVWEKNFQQEVLGAEKMIDYRKHLYIGCSEEGKAYIDARIKNRIELIYSVFLLLFKSLSNNDIMTKFDAVVYEYDANLYNLLNKKTIVWVPYVKKWRSDFDLQKIRRIIRCIKKIHNIITILFGKK